MKNISIKECINGQMNKKLPVEIMNYIGNFILKSVSHKAQSILHRTVIMVQLRLILSRKKPDFPVCKKSTGVLIMQ